MLLSIIIFTSILLLSLFFNLLPVVRNYRTSYSYNSSYKYFRCVNCFTSIWIPIIITTLLIGLRYDVGTDWYYYNYSYGFYKYISFPDAFFNPETYEWLFSCLLVFFNNINLPSYSIFIFATFISLLLYYYSFSQRQYLRSYGIFTLYTQSPFFIFLNIMRQGIAFFILTYVVIFIKKKRFLPYLLGVIIASGIHKSALLFLPFFLLAYYRKLIIRRSYALILYLITLLAGGLLMQYLLAVVGPLLDSTYAQYSESINFLTMERGSGLGLLLIHVCDIIMICLSPYCYDKFKQSGYDIYYNLFFIGVLIENIAGMNMLLARIPFCLSSMRIVVGAYTLYLCFNSIMQISLKNKTKILLRLCGMLYICCSLLYFIGNIIRFEYSFIFNH